MEINYVYRQSKQNKLPLRAIIIYDPSSHANMQLSPSSSFPKKIKTTEIDVTEFLITLLHLLI